MGDHCPVAEDMARDDLTREADIRLMYGLSKWANRREIASVNAFGNVWTDGGFS